MIEEHIKNWVIKAMEDFNITRLIIENKTINT